MGVHPNISADKFPKQGQFAGKTVRVSFNYETDKKFPAKCLRDDTEHPGVMIFQLEDGRVVLSTECQYSY